MNELLVFGELHEFLSGLGTMQCKIAGKSLSLGYIPFTMRGGYCKFATLYGDKRYQCLILHVEPGNPESARGKLLQKEIQEMLNFDIQKIRSFQLKKHEVYVPFEVVDSKEKMDLLKNFIEKQYMAFKENN
ncbi:hypothetical protein NST62_10665 [Ureibacillus sp. FSL K6-8385]|uniref:Uncharacterized protein n=1 Tax=Ureibacillus terrenus TaxID=118246 RepID=A0A540UX22_9BACL|nr:hypothetical protein [Ureibacillus terrenus]MED3662830.1 hypothetical protein [Ureibacillus terrenus]MED3762873.1 hypothetical protein [Ureibacillus terrenus]TQE89044.1 hypothetical protein FKZ59_12975 [Ureibacillus terrenus]